MADAIERFLNNKRKENLREATMAKLETIFKKQMLKWTKVVGIVHLAEITTRDLEGFRDTWKDGPLARKKKQDFPTFVEQADPSTRRRTRCYVV